MSADADNLSSALDLFAKSTVTGDRERGFVEFKHILASNRNRPKPDRLDEEAYRGVILRLGSLVLSLRTSYLASKRKTKGKQSSSSSTFNRSKTVLGNCSEAYRLISEAGVHTIGITTVRLILDHILKALPSSNSSFIVASSDHSFVAPIAAEYVKCMRIVLGFPPHVEHLTSNEWKTIAYFCMEAIVTQSSTSQPSDKFDDYGTPGTRTPEPSIESTAKSSSKDHLPFERPQSLVDDLVTCLHHLVIATNAPLQEDDLSVAMSVLSSLVAWLQSPRIAASAAHVNAFAAINVILSRTSFDSIDSTQNAIQKLIPVLRNFWATKLPVLREEMLITLIFSRKHIYRMLHDKSEDVEDFRISIENLVECMHTEYAKRLEREQLQIDDLRLRCSKDYPLDDSPFTLPIFRLKPGNARSENCWAAVYLIADLSNAIETSRSAMGRRHEHADVGLPNKKQRTLDYLQEFIRQISSPRLSARLLALQAISFMVQKVRLTAEDIRLVLEKLAFKLSDGDSAIANWAAIGTASCAIQLESSSPQLKNSWTAIWQLCSRNITTSSTCRAAAHAMDIILRLGLVDYSSIAEITDAIVNSIELHAPVLLSESTCSLWLTIFDVRNSESLHSSQVTTDRMRRWLFSKWSLSNFYDRSHATHRQIHYDAWDVIRILFMTTDRSPPPHHGRSFSNLGRLAIAELRASQTPQLAEYLLLLRREDEFLSQPRSVAGASTNVHQNRAVPVDTIILRFCNSEVEKTSKQFRDLGIERANTLNSDMIRSITILCVVCSQFSSGRSSAPSDGTGTLKRNTDSLIKLLASFISRTDCDQLLVDSVLEAIAPSLPLVASLNSLGSDDLGIGSLISSISEAVTDRLKPKDSIDAMELDIDFESQGSSHTSKGEGFDVPRDSLSADMSLSSARVTISATLYLLASGLASTAGTRDDSLASGASSPRVPEAFRRYMVELSAGDFSMCSRLLSDILESSLQLTPEDGEALLQSAVDRFLDDYEYERSETGIGLCVQLMSGTAMTWTDSGSTAHELGTDMYLWLLKKLLGAGAASFTVQTKVADLFRKLLKVQPEFATDLQMPLVRTSLLSLLEKGNIPLKFHIISNISEVFSVSVLSEHDDIFEHVHASLPNDAQSVEAMAIRLLAFARLGAAWHTLLRRSVYHIFETAGLVSRSAEHAARCIQAIAQSLGLDNSRALFRLFASQLLYTWTDNGEKIEDIPYSVCGYNSLALLLEDLQDEFYGQVAMRNNQDEVPILLKALEVSQEELAKRNFSKAAGYAMAWDQCRGRKDGISNESALRELLGEQSYKALLRQQFPCVLAVLISTMEELDQVEAVFHKYPEFKRVQDDLAEMRNISSSDASLPADQQPVFRAKYIFDEIRRLCRRTDYDAANFWTPDCLVYVMRYMLDKIHPALGSLHACSVIRKIRFLIALAGPMSFDGYALQMTLSSLRPFLTDAQCAGDTLGIVRYLLQHGKPTLTNHLSFVAGNSLSILVSLRVFLSTSQDSTTQESQHLATVEKAQQFDRWFSTYIETFVREQLQDTTSRSTKASLELFQSMMQAARDVRTTGNAVKGSPESNLLMALMKDDASDKRLLDGPSQSLAFSLLCRDFRAPPSFREDLLGDAKMSAQFATQVWKSSQRSNNSEQYVAWAARVLGRSYSASGGIQENLQRASRATNSANLRGRSAKTSRSLIVESLAAVLQGDEPRKAGISEQTLRDILTEKENEHPEEAKRSEEVKAVLPDTLVSGLTMNGAFKIPLLQPEERNNLEENAYPQEPKDLPLWVSDLCISLAKSTWQDRVVNALPKCLSEIPSLSEELFPYILHLALERDLDSDGAVQKVISDAYREWFQRKEDDAVPFLKVLLRSVLYLRTQRFPGENNIAERINWLDIDYLAAAEAAVRCGMHRPALLLAETHASQPAKPSRRSSVLPQQQMLPLQLQLSIYSNLDEPDSFYGVEQEPNLHSVIGRLDYESDGFKGLLFHGARMDSEMRRLGSISTSDSGGIVRDLTMLNLNSLTHAISSNETFRDIGSNLNHTLEVAQKLEQWDIRAPPSKTCEAAAVYKAFQGIHGSTDLVTVRKHLDQSFLETIAAITGPNISAKTLQSSFRTCAVLNEIDEIMTAGNADELKNTWFEIKDRAGWMKEARMEDFRPILSARETLFSMLGKNPQLQDMLHTGPKQLREREADALIDAAEVYRKHGALQDLLASATYLADIVPGCREVGFDIEGGAKYQVARALWDQGEKNTSIRMLQQLEAENRSTSRKDSTVLRAVLLTKLGQYTAEARLKKPEEIMKQYMEPAIRELKSNNKGPIAGQAYHAFAAFCDQQLQSQDLIDDQNRMRTLAERREADASEYDRMAGQSKTKNQRDWHRQQAKRARKWFHMDMQEAQRLGDSRVAFLRQSLENYLLALQACDEYDDDVFRMFSLWLEFSHLPLANNAVSKYIQPVPSGKFVVLMNQLSSRLLAEKSEFQQILSELVFRICRDHPYHGMHHIYAGSNMGSSSSLKDETAKSRYTAAKEIGKRLKSEKISRDKWDRLSRANSLYHDMAMYVDQTTFKIGRDYKMEKYPLSKKLVASIPSLRVPPITMHIPVRNSANYGDVPRISSFKPIMSIANGLSQPKIVTAYASDGRPFKQLYKSGNDDLRQDAIMEQVFEHVSRLLRSHTATRLRNLQIRTYKVVPLSYRSGVIEFVQNTMPLMGYLDSAHLTYHPDDWKQSDCRKFVSNISQHSHQERVKVYREVCRNFNPVLRYFFLERFHDPDDWFEKRLAYTRSTAAISILGHVLGLGDRHCHNILLDQQSGEAVHIDLGVAFEAGRVLPVPEVVPFRLTRDIVDAMGYTGVEGVFRRCCEFTLDTLRDERDSIMTILNVLRYDPLYSWSVSPIKAKKMQEEQQKDAANGNLNGDNGPVDDPSGGAGDTEDDQQRFLLETSARRKEDEGEGEAGRALSVVERKLSKALSSEAAVAELIQQATDERNLAVLFAGWSAWC